MTLRLARRRFLQVVGAAAVVAACGDGGSDGSAGGTSTPTAGDGSGPGNGTSFLAALFSTDRVIAAGSAQRLPLGVFNADRTPRRGDLPASTTLAISRDGTVIGSEAVELHGLDLPLPYYPLRTTLPEAGVYQLEIDLDGSTATAMVQAFEPGQVQVPQVGQPMPVVPTPTAADAHGVDPICTRFEPCPLHDVSLDQALGQGPVAVLVGTPAYCQTGVCGPVLEELMAAGPAHPGVTMIHAEVWANPREVGGNIADPAIRPAPIMEALSLGFEPVLFAIGSDGVIAERLDNVYDGAELERVLQRLT